MKISIRITNLRAPVAVTTRTAGNVIAVGPRYGKPSV